MLGYFIVPHDRRNYVVISAVEHIGLFYSVFYFLNEMLDFVRMFPANGGGGMGVRVSLSEFQNRSFRALRRKPCPCRYFSCLSPYLALVVCCHFILNLPCVAV